jgi:hypothetical protein
VIERNRSPYGHWGNFLFGLATLLEGLIRVLSLGYVHGNHRFTPLQVSKRLTLKHFQKLKRQAGMP